jgi:hypothetical protein
MKDYTHLVDMRVSAHFSDLHSQEFKEEISVFSAVGSQYFQGIPTYHYL